MVQLRVLRTQIFKRSFLQRTHAAGKLDATHQTETT